MTNDARYLKRFLTPIKVCAQYKPKFGLGARESGISCDKFLEIYGCDPFYSWCGLNSPLMYSAHKAAGGMTSIYRQIGKGCEYLFREIIIDTLGYTDKSSAEWSYTTKTQSGKEKRLSLDARIELGDINNEEVLLKIQNWLKIYCNKIQAEIPKNGIVFEIRQGYKSKDSKRQNADIDNIAVAWSHGYLPIFAIFSSQIDGDIILRYRNSRGGILVGSLDSNTQISLFSFFYDILGYDLAEFFRRNTDSIKSEIHKILQTLLSC